MKYNIESILLREFQNLYHFHLTKKEARIRDSLKMYKDMQNYNLEFILKKLSN